MTARALARWGATAACALLLAACATPPTVAPAGVQQWNGRLALNVEGEASRSFSAGFELKGAPEQGELTLFNPLGGTLAVLDWAPGTATLRAEGKTRAFGSLDELAQQATGAPLPVASLFDWLQGKATAVAGWQADVSQVREGRLHARRTDPPPLADLRLVFER
ncbi:outer membrane lipoprotein LolB [Ramlibacter ginsenosidimutans]|uniref:Outer-membrane lipoprotein LolB n=1 Tax=Ramlibacter ginsenosidimutans TaxID=502333 RepID=A0A934TQ19_9BURK|nr:outer membrane lipoprotein LolB [Ramlibacter ginsenosidimutans]